METCNYRSLSLLICLFALLPIFAIANCSSIVDESDGAVALMHDGRPIDALVAGRVRVKRLSCYADDWGCTKSCRAQSCNDGECNYYGGTCYCSGCGRGRGSFWG